MRISTAHAFDAVVEQLQQRQSDLAETQLQLSSGKRVSRPSDDPAAAARAERMLAVQARNTASQRAVDASRNAMSLTDTALGSATDLVQQVRETLIQAGNASLSDADRQSLAATLTGLRSQLLTVANSSDGAGGYLFGGQGSSSPPFSDAPGGVVFNGTSGQNSVSNGEPLPTALDGAATWLQARTGNGVFETSVIASNGSAVIDTGQVTDPSKLTGAAYQVQFSVSGGATSYTVLKNGAATALTNMPYTSGQAIGIDGLSFTVSGAPANGDSFGVQPSTPTLSVFGAIDKAVAALGNPNQTASSATQAVNFGVRDVDAALSQLQSARSQVGGVLNRLDDSSSQLGAQTQAAQTAQSQAEDLDMVQAISSFQNQQTAYQAALQAYSAVQRLSLLQYINN